MFTRLIAYVRGIIGRSRAVAEADDELQFHLEHEIAANVARGLSPAEARRVALRELGGLTQPTEAVREVRTMWLDVLGRDVRFAIRSLRRTPAFTAAALATLALVIGANTAVFSLADTILLRPLPYPQPDRIGRVSWMTRSPQGDGFGAADGRHWEAIHDQVTALDVAVETGGSARVNFNTDTTAAFVRQARVGSGYFRVLGVPLVIGREFTPDEDRPGGPSVAVISHALWERAFQSDPAAAGRTLLLRGELYEIVGVTPRDFTRPGDPVDVFTPVRPSRSGEGGGANYQVIARLRDGRTWPDAEGELMNLGRALMADAQITPAVTPQLSVRPLQDAMREGVKTPLQLLIGAGAMVLLIACVNLAALVLARGSGRQKEMATRLALGSSRTALVRQLVVESLMLGLAGGALGLGVAHGCLAGLQALGGDIFTEWTGATIDARTVAATAAASVVTALLFGLLPALQTTRVSMNAALTESGSRVVSGGARHWGRRVLIGAEVALSVVLLIVTGLFVRTLANLDGLDPGFDAANVAATSVSLQDARYTTVGAVNRLFDESLAELERTPGIESAAVSLELPYGRLLNYPFRFADRPVEGNPVIANFMYVSPGFLDTLRIPLRSGRGIAAADRAGQPPVAVVNDAFVRFLAEGRDPIGRFLRIAKDELQIVGVVGDVQTRSSGVFVDGMTSGPLVTPPIVFIAAAQMSEGFQNAHLWFSPHWTVRTSGITDADALLRRAISRADPLLPVASAFSLADVQFRATALQRLLLTLVGAFAATALLLAIVGIYGLVSQTVLERTREFGIRLALGATAAGTIRGVTLSAVAVTLAGALAGAGLAWGATQFVVSFLWGVDRHDPMTFIAIGALLLVTAAAASVIPALRILRIDPARILRS